MKRAGLDCYILGAGVTGMCAGMATGVKIFEALDTPGGICSSYYMGPDNDRSYRKTGRDSYRFEIGGGHWIFGASDTASRFIKSLSAVKRYKRLSAVYFRNRDLYVPYPIQNSLHYLPNNIRKKVLNDIETSTQRDIVSLSEWLEANFGRTLCELFFFPFHELYTKGLYKKISFQDNYKSPVDKETILRGCRGDTPPVGYNAVFIYPREGLGRLIAEMASRCRIEYGKKVVKIALGERKIFFKDGKSVRYEKIVSTLPLNKIIEMTGAEIGKPDPFTSVLVINIGALMGKRHPGYHWIYVPKSKSGFHRIGFYSNVDSSFLPGPAQGKKNRSAIYAEIAYAGGNRPKKSEMFNVAKRVVKELKEWNYISEAEVADPTWVDVAYTWQYPGSSWRSEAMDLLKRHGIFQVGRYGAWRFQGIADSITDGLDAKRLLHGKK